MEKRLSIDEIIGRVREIRTLKSQLSTEEGELTRPMLDDLSLIDDIYECYQAYLADNNIPITSAERRKFILVVLFLYSAGALAGGKMKLGIRDRVAEVTGCTRSLISHNCENLMFHYEHYKDFKDGVDDILRRVKSKLTLNLKSDNGACFARGSQIQTPNGLKNIEDFKTGDKVMGVNGELTVSEIFRGHGRLIRIRPRKGYSFLVNESHILCLFSRHRHCDAEMTVMNYLRQTVYNKRDLMLRCNGELVRFDALRVRQTNDYYGIECGGEFLDYQGFVHRS